MPLTPIEELLQEGFEREGVTARSQVPIGRFIVAYWAFHKAEGAFRQWGYEVAREEFADETVTEADLFSVYGGKRPEGRVVIKDRIADIMFQLMLLRPNEFDVIATTNLNGDYLSDAIAAEVGGVGIAPGANIADHVAVFEATHGTAPKYANLDKVNPGSLLFSGVMMLEYLGWKEAADLITFAFPEVIQKKIVTYDFARLMAGARAPESKVVESQAIMADYHRISFYPQASSLVLHSSGYGGGVGSYEAPRDGPQNAPIVMCRGGERP